MSEPAKGFIEENDDLYCHSALDAESRVVNVIPACPESFPNSEEKRVADKLEWHDSRQ